MCKTLYKLKTDDIGENYKLRFNQKEVAFSDHFILALLYLFLQMEIS
jgi:hypothetical protein